MLTLFTVPTYHSIIYITPKFTYPVPYWLTFRLFYTFYYFYYCFLLFTILNNTLTLNILKQIVCMCLNVSAWYIPQVENYKGKNCIFWQKLLTVVSNGQYQAKYQ